MFKNTSWIKTPNAVDFLESRKIVEYKTKNQKVLGATVEKSTFSRTPARFFRTPDIPILLQLSSCIYVNHFICNTHIFYKNLVYTHVEAQIAWK